MGAQFALGPCDAPGCRRCEAASQPSLLALPQRSVTRARYRGAVITAGTPEFRRPPQTRLASWHATHATSSVLPPLPTNVHPSHARQKHAPHRLRSTKNRCAEQGHTLRATRRHPPALIVFPLKTLASRPPAPLPENHCPQEPNAPLVHPRLGYPSSGCSPAEPDSVSPSNFHPNPTPNPIQCHLVTHAIPQKTLGGLGGNPPGNCP